MTTDIRDESALQGVLDALAKIMPITFENGPDYMSLYFGDGDAHRSQAMTMNPQDWLDLQAAYESARGPRPPSHPGER